MSGPLRAGLVDDKPNDTGQPKITIGTVAWSAITKDGNADDPAVRAIVDIPAASTTAEVVVRRSSEPGAAPFVIEVKLNLPEPTAIEAPRFRRTAVPIGEPIPAFVRRTGESFLVIPSPQPEDVAQAVRRILSAPWIDIPLQNGEYPLTITFEKGKVGQELLSAAFARWKLDRQTRSGDVP